MKYFNKSFLGSSRLLVEFAYQYGTQEAPRAWSKYTKGTSANIKVATGANDTPVAHIGVREMKKLAKEEKGSLAGSRPEEDDPKLQEFLKVMQPRHKQAIWSNDGMDISNQPADVPPKHAIADAGASDDEYEDIHPEIIVSDEENAADDVPVKDVNISDLDYLKSRVVKGFQDKNEGGMPETVEMVPETAVEQQDVETIASEPPATEESKDKTEHQGTASIEDTGRLFLRNLPYGATESDLRELLEPFGELSDIHLVLDKHTRKSKGFALASFANSQSAVDAHASLDGSIFMGRLLHILPGERPPPPPEDTFVDGGDSTMYREQKEKLLKATAGSNKVAWNSLFMRSDTVADAVAAHFGIKKSELLDREAADVAVRMALGETQVIAATKRDLVEAGVSVEHLEQAAAAAGKGKGQHNLERSDTALLVKNLPYSLEEAELEGLFTAHGPLVRFVVPSTHALAVLEYQDAADARRAFNSLAYKKYQHVPLYLEWAPKNIFSKSVPRTPRREPKNDLEVDVPRDSTPHVDTILTPANDGEDMDINSHTIFVKGLSFATQEPALLHLFEKATMNAGGSVRNVKVAKKKSKDNKMLSAGYGFVECSSEEVARAVLKSLQGTVLEGHTLSLQLSSGKSGAENAKRKLPKTTKMVVRNVAFESTRKDILGLFAPFGEIKSCRLPRKFDGTPRGFAFVDFATKQEAQNAMEAVHGAHLYGRRLVLEWAEEDGGLNELRTKTAARSRVEQQEEGNGMKFYKTKKTKV